MAKSEIHYAHFECVWMSIRSVDPEVPKQPTGCLALPAEKFQELRELMYKDDDLWPIRSNYSGPGFIHGCFTKTGAAKILAWLKENGAIEDA